MCKISDKVMVKWVKQKLGELTPRIRSLIASANYDLYFGPSDDDEYPGFVVACNEIRGALDDIDDIWIDTQSWEVLTKEPEGFLDDNPDYDPEDETSEEKIWQEPMWEDFVKVDRRQVYTELLGDELAASI